MRVRVVYAEPHGSWLDCDACMRLRMRSRGQILGPDEHQLPHCFLRGYRGWRSGLDLVALMELGRVWMRTRGSWR